MDIRVLSFRQLPDEEKQLQPDNGCGREEANYLEVDFGEGLFKRYYSDAMESEDCSFRRDLSWIKDLVKMAYEVGVQDGRKK